MNSVLVPVRVTRIRARQSPFVWISTRPGRGGTRRCDVVDYESEEGRKARGIDNATGIEVSIKCVLIRGAWIVGDFYTTSVPRGVVIDVEVGSFVETMQQRTDGGLGKVIMTIREAVLCQLARLCHWVHNVHRDQTLLAWKGRHSRCQSSRVECAVLIVVKFHAESPFSLKRLFKNFLQQ